MRADTIQIMAYLELLWMTCELNPEVAEDMLSSWVETFVKVRNKSIELTGLYNDLILILQNKDFSGAQDILVNIDELTHE